MNDTVVAIVSAFFVIGITVGIIVVFAMSALRADRRHRVKVRYGPRLEYRRRLPGDQPPGPGWDDAAPDDQPSWPGDADNDFSGK
jgi:hypothetical protein